VVPGTYREVLVANDENSRAVIPRVVPAAQVGGPACKDALQALTEMITSGKLGPGSRLPTERQLAQLMGLSRNTVRESISALAMLRVLDVRRGDGIYVTSLAPEVLLEATSFVVQLLQDHSVIEMMQVRAVLESAAAEMAAIKMSAKALTDLEQTMHDFAREPWSDRWLELDRRFHALIASASGNDVLASLLSSLSSETYRARHVQGNWLPPEQFDSARLQHRRIFEAIERRDHKAAGFEAGAHVSGTVAWLRELIDAASSEDGDDS
jgi:GntR family transcriptional regulator, transcriptional repressor for pyruvate dehydrogenase complex